jgi:hypothetical protein
MTAVARSLEKSLREKKKAAPKGRLKRIDGKPS